MVKIRNKETGNNRSNTAVSVFVTFVDTNVFGYGKMKINLKRGFFKTQTVQFCIEETYVKWFYFGIKNFT